MATRKTEATELSVAHGLLGIAEPSNQNEIATLFGGSVSIDAYKKYTVEFFRDRPLYTRFIQCGLRLREKLFPTVNTVIWMGGQQQAATMMASADLFIPSVNTHISVKNESNVVANLSPHNLFRSLPKGEAIVSKGADWFIEKDEPGLQAAYSFIRSFITPGNSLPDSIGEFYRNTARLERKKFQRVLKAMSSEQTAEFENLYRQMCSTVSLRSAEEFNANFATLPSNARPAVLEAMVKQFFRIDHLPYILTGIDHRQEFAVQIPALTAWKREWLLQNILATPRPGGQSLVSIALVVQAKMGRATFALPYRVEIRWSHGKFCGNPESKLYKEFSWQSVPFFAPMA
jgi:hypothetical protein